MNNSALSTPLRVAANKLNNNQKCCFTDANQLHKAVIGNNALWHQLSAKAQKAVTEYKHICPDVQKIKNQALSSMSLPQFFRATKFIFTHLQENEFSLLNGINKANWQAIIAASDNLQKSRTLTYQEMKALLQFYDVFSKKGLNFGSFKTKLETFKKFQAVLQRFEANNASVKSDDVDELHKYLKSNHYKNQLILATRNALDKHDRAVIAYNKTLNELPSALKEVLKKMVDANDNNATTFQILVADKVVENLKDFPADKRKNFIAERDRLKSNLTDYNITYIERSSKLFNKEVFTTIEHLVKRITEEVKGVTENERHHIEELMADVRINHSVLEFRTHKNGIRDPYFHQGTDFSAWEHEGILYCPSKFPTKDNTMLEADEIIVLNVSGGNSNPLNNYITIVMVNHKKGIIFNTYRHIHEIYVKEGIKTTPNDVLGNYWKYIKNPNTNDAKLIGYAKPTNKSNRFTGVSLNHLLPEENPSRRTNFPSGPYKGAFPIYHFPNKGDFPYFIKKPGNIYYMLENDNTQKIHTKDIKDMKLKLKNEHFHIERRFMDKATYVASRFGKEEVLPLGNINLSQNFTKHFNNHEKLKELGLNSSFGKLLPASALLDTGSTDSKILLRELITLRDAKPYTEYTKKNYGKLKDGTMPKLIKATTDAVIRDYTMLLIFEKIVKLGCELQKYTNKTDNCKLSELQAKITKAKNLLETKKFAKPSK